MNQYINDEQFAHGISIGAYGARMIWDTPFEFCTGSGSHIVMRTADLGGRFLTPDVLAQEICIGASSQYSAIAVLSTGEFLVARERSGPLTQIYGRTFDQNGNPISGDFSISSTGGADLRPDVVAHPSGRFLVLWERQNGGSNPYGRVVLPDGSMPQAEVLLSSNSNEFRVLPHAAMVDGGDLVVVWESVSQMPPNPTTVEGRYLDADLSGLGPEFQISQPAFISGVLGVAVAATGPSFAVTWYGPGPSPDILARWFDRYTGPLTGEIIVNTYTTDAQLLPEIAMDAQGRSCITWVSYGEDGSSFGVYGQRFDVSGSPRNLEFRINMTTLNPQGEESIAMLPSGDFAILFVSRTGNAYDGDAFVRRFFFPLSLAVAPGPFVGNAAQVEILRPDGGQGGSTAPYAGGYGATVGAGDIDGSGPDEILTGPGPSPVYGPHVRAFLPDATPVQKVSFYAYGTLRYGVKPQGGNLDGDAAAEILSTPGQGAVFGPHVRGWNYDGVSLTAISKVSFFAYGTLKYGANSSHGNVDGDAYDEILTGPGPGVMFAPQLRGFNYDGSIVTAIAKINANAFPTTSYGATISAADIESDGIGGYGDGYEELLAGQGPGPGFSSELRIFDYDNASLTQKFSVTPYTTLYGLHTAGGDVDAGDTEEVVTAPGPDPAAPAHILCWEWNPALGTNTVADLQTIGTDDFVAFPGELYGVNVAVGTFE